MLGPCRLAATFLRSRFLPKYDDERFVVLIHRSLIDRTFHEILESALKSYAAIRKRKVPTEHTPWLNSIIKAQMHERDRTKRLALNDVSLWPKYKIQIESQYLCVKQRRTTMQSRSSDTRTTHRKCGKP